MEKRQRVIIIGPAYPYRGGLSAFNERLARAFEEAGYEMAIHTFRLQYPKLLFPGKTQFSEDPPPVGLAIRRTINTVNPLNWPYAAKQIRDFDPVLVVVRFWLPFLGPSLGSILRLVPGKKTKLIGIVDNIVPHEKRPGDFWFARYFVGSLDACVVMSGIVGKQLQKFVSSQPIVECAHPVYDNYGPPLARAEALGQLGLESKYRYLLFFGFIRPYKGLDLALQALALVRDQLPEVRLIVAGEFYTDPAPYEKIISTLQLEDRVILHTRFISNEQVAAYFGAADLVVQPYRSATQSGISELAYFYEKPVLVTNVGGLPEIVRNGQTGLIVEPEPESLAAGILKFFQIADPLETFGAGIREEKKRHSWAALVETLLKIRKQIT